MFQFHDTARKHILTLLLDDPEDLLSGILFGKVRDSLKFLELLIPEPFGLGLNRPDIVRFLEKRLLLAIGLFETRIELFLPFLETTLLPPIFLLPRLRFFLRFIKDADRLLFRLKRDIGGFFFRLFKKLRDLPFRSRKLPLRHRLAGEISEHRTDSDSDGTDKKQRDTDYHMYGARSRIAEMTRRILCGGQKRRTKRKDTDHADRDRLLRNSFDSVRAPFIFRS
jgi:hypothetical protein